MSDNPDLLAELHRLADFHERKSQYAKTVHALRQAAAEVESLRADNQAWAVRWQEQYDRAERLAHQAGDRP